MIAIIYSLGILILFGLSLFALDVIRSVFTSGSSGLTELLIHITPEAKRSPELEKDFDKFMKQKDNDDWN